MQSSGGEQGSKGSRGLALIRCENLAFAYDGETVLKNVNFSVKQGEYLCIVGENGAGKSTLVRGLLGLKKPCEGRIVFEALHPHEIGYLPQQTRIQKDFPASVYEVVLSGCLNALGKRFFYGSKEKVIAEKNMKALGIERIRHSCFRELSGGQQQRVLLARALSATGKIILLDEPASGLDPKVTLEVYDIINRINREMGITVVMVSHDIHSAMKYADKILHIKQEQLFFGTPSEYEVTKIGETFIGSSCQYAAPAHEHALHCEMENVERSAEDVL